MFSDRETGKDLLSSSGRTTMRALLRIAHRIDRTNEWIGRIAYSLTLVMVGVGAYNTLVRYLDRFTGLGLSSNTYIELQWYMYSLIFLLGAAWTLKQDAHVRVDVLFARLTPRGRAWVDLGGAALFLLPFCALVIWTSWSTVYNSWAVLEVSPDPGGLPRYPIKTVILIAFFLLFLQGISLAIRKIDFLFGAAEGPAEPDPEVAAGDSGETQGGK